MHYLNDFLGVLSNEEIAETFVKHFDHICTKLGLKINLKKTLIGQTVESLSIKLNIIEMTARLSTMKLQKAIKLVNIALSK